MNVVLYRNSVEIKVNAAQPGSAKLKRSKYYADHVTWGMPRGTEWEEVAIGANCGLIVTGVLVSKIIKTDDDHYAM